MAAHATVWTADDIDRLPDDGNRYEVVDGRLLVTPPPAPPHEAVAFALARAIATYVEAHGLGAVFLRNDLRFDRANRVDPDLSVVPLAAGELPRAWRDAPRPTLVVEVLSPTGRRQDLVWKRALYRREAVPLCWIVDHAERLVHVVRPAHADEIIRDVLNWHPAGTPVPLTLDLQAFFRKALREG